MDGGLEGERKRKYADGSEILKWAVVAEVNLHRDGPNSVIPDGYKEEIANRFGVSCATVGRYIAEWDAQRLIAIVPDLSVGRVGVCGVGNLKLSEVVIDCIFELCHAKKGSFTYEKFTKDFNEEYQVEPPISASTMYRWFKRLEVVETHSYVKPTLETRHLKRRLDFILGKLSPMHEIHKIKDHSRYIHLDEKWFFAVRTHKKIKLLPGMEVNAESTRHKSHIMKVMFIAAVGMPQTLPNGTFFDGKIGIFPVIRMAVAKRNSKNRPAGADVVENVSMTAAQYLHMMTMEGGILQTVREKMAWAKNDNIVIQHDGAPGHIDKTNAVALPAAGQLEGYNITFEVQPAQSPDLNLCDLCFFNSLQKRSFELRSKSTTEMQLMATVQEAWDQYDWQTLERSWGHLFAVYRAVLDAGGTNQYTKPHSGVRERQHDGAGTIDPYVSMDTYLSAMEARDALNHV